MTTRAGLSSMLVAAVSFLDVATAHADMFHLDNGEILQGSIISSVGNTISIRLDGRGMRQLPIKAIDHVEVELISGEQAIGTLLGWSKNTYKIVADDRLLSVSDGEVTANVAADLEAIDKKAPDDGIGGPRLTLAKPEERAGDEGNIEKSEPIAASDTRPVLSWSTSPASEDAGEAIVSFRLSQTVSRPIAVIYSAMDGSAKGGADFQKTAGVVTIEAGSSEAEVRITIVDDDQTEPDEQFGLFLSVDPNNVQAQSRNVVVSIEDDDL